MESRLTDTGKAAAVELIAAGLTAFVAAGGADPSSHDQAMVMTRELEVLGRQIKAMQIGLVGAINQHGFHKVDGHASAKVMVRHIAHLSNAEASRRASAARALRDLPLVAAAFAAGTVGFCQVERISRAWANPRVRERLITQDQALVTLGAREGYERFDAKLSDWVRRTDEDGTCDRSQRTHQNRNAQHVQDFDGSWKFTASSGSLTGVKLNDIFNHFIDAEFHTDWDNARREHGDNATTAHLARTDAQRRADAFTQIFQQAASNTKAANTDGHGAGSQDTTTNADSPSGAQITTDIVIDQATFERQLRRLTGTPTAPLDVTLDPEPGTDTYRCSTIDGRWVDPTEAVAAALIGHVRRVVVGADSVITNLSRRQRLFRGPAALAVRLSSTHCYWPGCHVPVSNCQIDHLIPWANPGNSPGQTNPHNGGPACGKHNRYKERGYTVHRDANGAWHTHRPNGTEIF